MQRESDATSIDAAPRLGAWSGLAPPQDGLRSIVIVPVRNEADRLARCLAALSRQRPLKNRGGRSAPDFEVLLLANNCEDDSVRIARRVARSQPWPRVHVAEVELPPPSAHIGFVRRELMNEACRRLAIAGHPSPVIASTDADTRVAPDWLAANLAEIDAGADAVGGRILIDDEQPPASMALRQRRLDTAHSLMRCRIAALLDPEPVNPWPNHHQHFGASLAIRAAAYRQVGGVPPVRYLEDDALVRALDSADFAIRRSHNVRVTTSGRLDGRADVGLSWQLRQWKDADGDDPLVEPADAFIAAVRAKAALRSWWRTRQALADDADSRELLSRMAVQLQLDGNQLRDEVDRASAFGLLWSRLSEVRLGRLTDQRKTVPRSEALHHLRAWLRRHGRGPSAAT